MKEPEEIPSEIFNDCLIPAYIEEGKSAKKVMNPAIYHLISMIGVEGIGTFDQIDITNATDNQIDEMNYTENPIYVTIDMVKSSITKKSASQQMKESKALQ